MSGLSFILFLAQSKKVNKTSRVVLQPDVTATAVLRFVSATAALHIRLTPTIKN